MKELSGQELVRREKERQADVARQLREEGVVPRLVIFYDNDSPVIAKYVELKQEYGWDICVKVDVVKISAKNAKAKMTAAAEDENVHGIIVQLPLKNASEDILKMIPVAKDVDGLNGGFDSATAAAIDWLLDGYKVRLAGKRIAIVGRGKLVGAPLRRMWKEIGYNVTVFHRGDDLLALRNFDVIVSGAGVPGLIKSEMVKAGAVVVDAGTASEGGELVGDVDEAVRLRDDIAAVTPKFGGVGPLTVSMLFEHVLWAAGGEGTGGGWR